jgi:transposase
MATRRDAVVFEQRRLKAMSLYDEGVRQADIARRLGVTRQSVSRWVGAFERGGRERLRRKPRPGRPPKLTQRQKDALLRALAKGAQSMGYATQLWTAERIRHLVRDHFGQCYHVHHIPKLLHQLGWSYQRPMSRARERDEAAIARWLRKDWPRIKKKPAARERS